MPDITFDIGQHYFNLRVGVVIEQDKHLLINRQHNLDFWFLPGGRVSSGETTEEALHREIREEINIEVDIVRTLFIVESFSI